jgi:endo-1,4-beta-xylanase
VRPDAARFSFSLLKSDRGGLPDGLEVTFLESTLPLEFTNPFPSMRRRLPSLLTLAGILLSLPPLALAQEQAIPTGGTNIVSANALATAGWWGGSGTVTRQLVSVAGPGFTQAIEIDIVVPAAENWNGQFQVNLNSAVAAGDVALLHFWMRVTESGDESGAGSLFAMVEQAGSPFTKSASTTVTASSEWYPFYIPFSFAAAYAAGGVQIKFGLGQGDPRKVQIGGVQLFNYGQSRTVDELPQTEFTYVGREAEASWRAPAAARIEAHRKGDFTLELRDAAGRPRSGHVTLELARHQFHFASVIDARTLIGSGADNALYREKLVELFNASGTENDLKWPPMEGDWGVGFNYTNTAAALEWLRLRGFFLRGHVLVWPGTSNLPNYIRGRLTAGGAQAATVPQEVLDHIDETVEKYAPWIDEWDVLNEPYSNTTLLDTFGATHPGLYADWFKRARTAAGPTVGLYLNDFAILSGLGQDVVKHAATIATLRDIVDRGDRSRGWVSRGTSTSPP